MKAYSYDYEGYYEGEVPRQPSPLEPGVYLVPARAILIAPPLAPDDTVEPQWTGTEWVLVKSRIQVQREAESPIEN